MPDFPEVGPGPGRQSRKQSNPLGHVLHRHPQLDPIVWRIDQILLRAEVSLRRLHRRMAQQQLDLLQFAAGPCWLSMPRPAS
jgi:hypothetical protein